MTDAPQTGGALPPDLDDDRLLAYVLGLQTDPQLEAAAIEDAALRRRLDALRSEMMQIHEQVARAVPEPSETYTDLSEPRWATLRPHLQEKPRTAARGRPRAPSVMTRWLRVAAPIAAGLVVLAVGVGVLRQPDGSVLTNQGDKAADLTAPEVPSGGAADAERAAEEQAGLDQADLYDVVLIARAGPLSSGFQRFDVVRMLRGSAPAVLRLRVVTRAAEAGRLHVVYLSPSRRDEGETSSTAGDEGLSQSMRDDLLRFEEGGDTVLAARLPADADPDDIALP